MLTIKKYFDTYHSPFMCTIFLHHTPPTEPPTSIFSKGNTSHFDVSQTYPPYSRNQNKLITNANPTKHSGEGLLFPWDYIRNFLTQFWKL